MHRLKISTQALDDLCAVSVNMLTDTAGPCMEQAGQRDAVNLTSDLEAKGRLVALVVHEMPVMHKPGRNLHCLQVSAQPWVLDSCW